MPTHPESVRQHLHLLDDDLVLAELFDGGQPLDLDALGERFHGLVGVGLHLRLVEAKDDHGLFGAETFRDARGVHRGIAAADDADDPPERWRAALFDTLHQRHGVDDLAAVHRRNVEVIRDLRADPEEHRIERSRGLLGQHVVHARVANDRDPHRLDARDLLVEPLPRQAVGGNPVVHHAARFGVGITDLDVVSEASQVVSAGEPGRSGADHEHALSGGRARGDRPALLVREIAEKPVERVDRDGRIEKLPVAGAFAGVIARAAVGARQRVFFHVLPPRLLVVAGLRQGEPGLDVLAGGTNVVAGRKVIDEDRALPSARASAFADRLFVDRRQILRNETHGCPSIATTCRFRVVNTAGQFACLSDVVENTWKRRRAPLRYSVVTTAVRGACGVRRRARRARSAAKRPNDRFARA